MENYVKPDIELVAVAAADLISASVTLDENELSEDRIITA